MAKNNRLSDAQHVKLTRWLSGCRMQLNAENMTTTDSASLATLELGFDVTAWNISNVYRNTLCLGDWPMGRAKSAQELWELAVARHPEINRTASARLTALHQLGIQRQDIAIKPIDDDEDDEDEDDEDEDDEDEPPVTRKPKRDDDEEDDDEAEEDDNPPSALVLAQEQIVELAARITNLEVLLSTSMSQLQSAVDKNVELDGQLRQSIRRMTQLDKYSATQAEETKQYATAKFNELTKRLDDIEGAVLATLATERKEENNAPEG